MADLLLHSPWYMTSRSGWPMQRASSRVHSSLYVWPSLPHTACLRVMWEQSGEHTHCGRPVFILHTFPGLHFTPSQVSAVGRKKKKSTIAVVVKDGVATIQVDDVAAIHSLHNVDSNHRCLLTVTHRSGVSPPGESGGGWWVGSGGETD